MEMRSSCTQSRKRKERLLIRAPWNSPLIAMHTAAREIQRIARGFIVRHTTFVYGKLEGVSLGEAEASFAVVSLHPFDEDETVSEGSFIREIAAREIQYIWRKMGRKNVVPDAAALRMRGALFMQRAWKRYQDRKVFRELLDLVRFKNEGDPRDLLRGINPGEAGSFERCTRIQVRFRFGGEAFPPEIYYKIYTNGPVCDVGAFAPRQYGSYQMASSRDLNNKCQHSFRNEICTSCMHLAATSDVQTKVEEGALTATIAVGSTSFEAKLSEPAVREFLTGADGWYQRRDRNGWRLVTPQALDGSAEEVQSKASSFHSSRALRTKDKRLRMKLRRREWLRKIYFEEKESKDDFDLPDMDDEDHLLDWTQGLDYEEYMLKWSELGTSGLS